MGETILEVSHLSYLYGTDQEALKDVSVSMEKGEKIAVIGSNGAGKSTFFLNLNGVLTPHEGTVSYRGRVITKSKKDLNYLRKNVGIVFQDADNQIIASTVFQEVSFGPMNLKLAKEEVTERVREALSYMNITRMRDRAPHYLSGGEKKRVSIADIIAMKPEVIIFDEPTASLDPMNASMLEEVLKKLEQEGRTILISTHDIDFAYRWAERILVFEGGRIIADGKPVEIFQNDEVLARANLRKPTFLEVFETLEQKGLVRGDSYPRDIQSFRALFK
ncbi:energy-coupling factor ABC transporter ATP-binding protein [Qiania dongpingensis]|uniref:ABC transporter ATP-binding protein n=1 Tax=Qiania dongpingensis TaxID=2763669 RepID=A0A7G9G5N0_9FIRM|nr:ATP-binding cassette domain-containing protein [Qiania dongpingensis]QNM06112.1 ATP-binding cassette domain-containing protein [Qiania dongpingensis]